MRSGCVARRSFRSSVCETSLLSATLLNERGEREKKERRKVDSCKCKYRGNTALKTRRRTWLRRVSITIIS